MLLELERRAEAESGAGPASGREAAPVEKLKPRRPNRNQFTYAAADVEALIAPQHPARAIWELTGRLEPRAFAEPLRGKQGEAGRPAWEPRLLLSAWIWACSEGTSSARELRRQCGHHPALQWLCGLETIGHKSLSDFRPRTGRLSMSCSRGCWGC